MFSGLTYVSEGLPEKGAYFLFPKNSSLLTEFNPAIISRIDFIIRTYNKYFIEGYRMNLKNIPKCPEDTDGTLEKLSLITTFGIFLIVFIGLGLSILFFIAELYVSWQHQVIRMRLKTRRAIAEPIHLIALAQMFGDARTQNIINKQIGTPTVAEKKEHISVAETSIF